MVAKQILTSLIGIGAFTMMASHEAKAIDWGSRAPRPDSARLLYNEAELKPKERNSILTTYYAPVLPKHVWCYAHDDQQGGNRREGQCFGVSTGNCLQGYLGRRTHGSALKVYNEHSRDTRYFTLYDDLGPKDPWPIHQSPSPW